MATASPHQYGNWAEQVRLWCLWFGCPASGGNRHADPSPLLEGRGCIINTWWKEITNAIRGKSRCWVSGKILFAYTHCDNANSVDRVIMQLYPTCNMFNSNVVILWQCCGMDFSDCTVTQIHPRIITSSRLKKQIFQYHGKHLISNQLLKHLRGICDKKNFLHILPKSK